MPLLLIILIPIFLRYHYHMYVVLMTYSFIIMYFKVCTCNGALDRSTLVGCQPSRQLSSTERIGRIYMLD